MLEWIGAAPPVDALIAMGDFNADPTEPTYGRMRAAGFRSAYAEANGAEPAVTWPSGLQAPAMDTDGSPECLDYIWVKGAVSVESARLAFDRPDPEDPTLYPSDHLGISAHLGDLARDDPAAGSSRRLAPRAGEHDRGVPRRPRDPRLRRPRVRRPHCGRRRSGRDPRRDPGARPGGERAGRRPDHRGARGSWRPDPRGGALRAAAPGVPRRRAEGGPRDAPPSTC